MIVSMSYSVRIESSPVRRRAKATKKLLSNEVTAKHYQVGAKDALGNIIALGKPMDFIDWKSKDRVWNVYHIEGGRFVTKGTFPTLDEAKEFSITI